MGNSIRSMNLMKLAGKFFPEIDFVFAKIAGGKALVCGRKVVWVCLLKPSVGFVFWNGGFSAAMPASEFFRFGAVKMTAALLGNR